MLQLGNGHKLHFIWNTETVSFAGSLLALPPDLPDRYLFFLSLENPFTRAPLSLGEGQCLRFMPVLGKVRFRCTVFCYNCYSVMFWFHLAHSVMDYNAGDMCSGIILSHSQ